MKKAILGKDENGKSRGFGYVEFENKEGFDKAIELKGALIQGRPISIKKSEVKKP